MSGETRLHLRPRDKFGPGTSPEDKASQTLWSERLCKVHLLLGVYRAEVFVAITGANFVHVMKKIWMGSQRLGTSGHGLTLSAFLKNTEIKANCLIAGRMYLLSMRRREIAPGVPGRFLIVQGHKEFAKVI